MSKLISADMVLQDAHAFSEIEIRPLLIYEGVSWIWRSCGDRTDIGKANLWFVLKCRSSPVVILRPFRNGSEPKHSQTIIYVRFDRADAIEPLLVDVKYTYHGIHLECPLG